MTKQIEHILQEILTYCQPDRVILYGEKRDISTHAVKSGDFCIILPEVDKNALLRTLYLHIDAEIPFQILLYTTEEWETLVSDYTSYAAAIQKKGTVLYEPEP